MLLVVEIFRANLPANHSENNCSSLSVAVISVAVVDDVYSVESSAYIETLALLSQWHVISKNLKSKGPKRLRWRIPDFS